MNINQNPAISRLRFASKLVAVIGLCTFGAAYAQGTDSSIFGKAPTGTTIVAHSATGVTRHVTADSKGRYSFNHLPLGTYTVSLEKDGKTLANLNGAELFVGRSFGVDFACDNDQCTVKPAH